MTTLPALFVLALGLVEGLPRWSEPGRREIRGYRPLRRIERFYTGRALVFGRGLDTDALLLRALDGLARSQNPDGSWDSGVGVTSTALLAFLDAGFTTWAQEECRISTCRSGASTSPAPGPVPGYHVVIRRAIEYLLRSQEPDGFIGARGSPTSLRDHAIAARALCEAWGGSQLLILLEPAQRAIGALTLEPGLDDDVMAWTATAIRSVRNCWLPRSPTRRERELIQGLRKRTLPQIEETADPHRMYWGTEVLYLYDTGSRIWSRWAQSVVAAIRSQADSAPRMEVALRALTLTVVYQPAIFWADR